MICEQCKYESKKSKVYPGMYYTTYMYCPPFYYEDGNIHYHDYNTTITNYKCSNGHEWTNTLGKNCWCGWPNELQQTKET